MRIHTRVTYTIYKPQKIAVPTDFLNGPYNRNAVTRCFTQWYEGW